MDVIVIDCGTSFIKGVLFRDEHIIRRIQKKTPEGKGKINGVLYAYKNVLDELSYGLTSFKLGMSTEMHGFLLCDKSGNQLTDYISWQTDYGNQCIYEDNRMITSRDKLAEKNLKNEIIRTGMPLKAGLPSCNLMYLIKIGDVHIEKGTSVFCTLGEYLVYKMFGRWINCHVTNAASTGLYDLIAGDWNRHLIDVIGASDVCFPEVGMNSLGVLYNGKAIEIYPAFGDQQAALYGAGLNKDSQMSFNIGTGGQVSMITDEPEFCEDYQIRPYYGGSYIKTIPSIPSGRALNVYFRLIKDAIGLSGTNISDDELWKRILEEAYKDDSSKLECDMSFFANSITDKCVGSIGNIDEKNLSVGALFHSVFEQIVNNYIRCALVLKQDLCDIDEIIFSGGVAQKISYIRNGIGVAFGNECKSTLSIDDTLVGVRKAIEDNAF